jgi:hypothetical protein
MLAFTESVVEEAALAWPESLGYAIKHLPAPQGDSSRQAGGPEIAPGNFSKRTDRREVVPADRGWPLVQKMHIALKRQDQG